MTGAPQPEAADPDRFAGLAGGVGWSTLSAVVLRVSQFSMGIIAARIIAPDQFGAFAVALTVYGILIMLSDIGVAQAVVREVDRTARIGPTVMTLNMASTLVVAGVMAAVAGPVARTLGAPDAAPAIMVLAGTMVVGALGTVPAAILARDYRQRDRFVSDGLNLVASSVVMVVLALSGWGVMALAFARLAGQAVSAVVLNTRCRERYRYGWDRTEARHLVGFGTPLAVAAAVMVAVQNVDNVVVARVRGPVQLGYYNQAFTVASWPVGVFTSVLLNVTVTTFARVGEDAGELRRHLRAAMGTLTAAAAPASALIIVLADPLVRGVYGQRWAPAAPVLAVLTMAVPVRVVQILMADLLVALGRTVRLFWVHAAWLVVLVPALIVGVRSHGILGAGYAHLVVMLVVVLPLTLLLVNRCVPVGVSWLVGSVAWPLAAAVAGGAAAWGAARLVHPPLLRVLVGGAAGLAVYLVLVWPWLRRHIARLRELYGGAGGAVPA